MVYSMKRSLGLLLLTITLCASVFSSCDKNNKQPIPDPLPPTVDVSQLMGKGELFNRLARISGVSDIVAVRGKYHSARFDEEYEFFIEQYIDPKNPAVGKFKQRARIGHIGFDSPMVLVTEGYAMKDIDESKICWNDEGGVLNKEDPFFLQGEEIASHLKANMLIVEHRYFYKSNPDNRNWEYLTSENASADLHKVFESLKPLYNKAWIASGVSKGGMTTMYYHLFYPNDVDICVPYVAPMCYSLADDRARAYVQELAGDATLRQQILNCKNIVIAKLANPDEQQKICNEYRKQWKTDEGDSEILGILGWQIIRFDSEYWSDGENWVFEIMPGRKDIYNSPEWIVNWFAKLKLTDDNKYGKADKNLHDSIINPIDFLNTKARTRATFIDIDSSTKKVNKTLPYYYMAIKEQGRPLQFGTKGLNLQDLKQDGWKDFYEKACQPSTAEELFILEGFDPANMPTYSPDLYNKCISYYQKTDDKIIFIYGANDFWTGCGINDVWKDARSDRQKYPTFGFDQKKQMSCYLVPGKGHGAIIYNLPKNQQDELWSKIDKWVKEIDK